MASSDDEHDNCQRANRMIHCVSGLAIANGQITITVIFDILAA